MKKVALLVCVSMLVGGYAFAKPTSVKGAACTACHNKEGKKSKENLNKAATDNLAKTLDKANAEFFGKKCSDCHEAKDGKLTVTKK